MSTTNLCEDGGTLQHRSLGEGDWHQELAIRSLLARCTRSLDRGEDEAEFLDCWTDDAVFLVSGKSLRSREERRLLFHGVQRPIRHMMTDSVITMDEDNGHHECNLLVFGDTDQGPYVRTHGFYSDHLLHTRSGWRLISRLVTKFA